MYTQNTQVVYIVLYCAGIKSNNELMK